jgi:hypothetical protein
MADSSEKPSASNRQRYTWPWFLLVGFLAAVALAALWLSFEIQRTRRIRDLNQGQTRQGP